MAMVDSKRVPDATGPNRDRTRTPDVAIVERKINPWQFPPVKPQGVKRYVPRFNLDLPLNGQSARGSGSKDVQARGSRRVPQFSRQQEVVSMSSPDEVYLTPSPGPPLPLGKQQTNPYIRRQTSSPRNIPRGASRATSPSSTISSPDEVFLTPSPRRYPLKPQFTNIFDPYQVFEVEHRPCTILEVKVVRGRNITKGWSDYMDTPDPYIYLCLPTAPEGRRKTEVRDNDVNPVWDETFTFFIDEAVDNFMEVRLMESNYTYDEVIGIETIRLGDIRSKLYKKEKKTLLFNGVSEVDLELTLTLDTHPTLRYSLCLCDQEKEFLKRRRKHVMDGMKQLLGDRAPRALDETPTISVIGSGGGFRAMVGLSGVIKALHDSGVLQCCTYVGGLSGSSWYISTLYSHENWPKMAPGDMQEELKANINSSLLWLLSPQGVYRYLDRIMKKRQMGQPVSFTDFFGHMVGETLLKTRLDIKLSDVQDKIADGRVPMPLLTCVHVKKDRSARSFQEWVEFSPYEIGMAKYGTFMKTELFGSKFFMGKLVKSYEEPPLHFLQGIWGSAFCILFKRLLDDNRKLDPVEMIRQEMAKKLEENEQDESSDSSDDGEFDDTDTIDAPIRSSEPFALHRDATGRLTHKPASHDPRGANGNGPVADTSPGSRARQLAPKRMISTRRTKNKGYWSGMLKSIFEKKNFEVLNTRAGRVGVIHNFMRGLSLQQSYPMSPFSPSIDNKNFEVLNTRAGRAGVIHNFMRGLSLQQSYPMSPFSPSIDNKNFEVLNTRAGRAGVIHNFMRGLSLQQSYPMSPFSPSIGKSMDVPDGTSDPITATTATTTTAAPQSARVSNDFDGIFEMHPTNVKHLYMVDAGLTFNSPYPLMLRPQREVDIILSFDFSARPSDSTPPFKELLLAESWAKKHKVSFPPIDTTVVDREGLKEMYIFKHPSDPHCPIVLHFCLVNIEFRKFSKPGVRRRTKEDKEFAEFDIFDDPNTPYSTFNFKYPGLAFERLSKLTEFNTLLNIEEIKTVIAETVEKKRKIPSKCPCTLEDIPRLRRVSQKNKNRLSRFVSRIRSGRYSASEAAKDLEKDTITEERSIDIVDGELPTRSNKNGDVTATKSATLSRQRGITRKSPRPERKSSDGENDVADDVSVPQSGSNGLTVPEKREIPGRRKPRQPEAHKLWQDSKCNSIDEEDDNSQFFTALSS